MTHDRNSSCSVVGIARYSSDFFKKVLGSPTHLGARYEFPNVFGNWNNAARSGVFARNVNNYRTNSNYNNGFRHSDCTAQNRDTRSHHVFVTSVLLWITKLNFQQREIHISRRKKS